ncbi:MAG: inositol monophosphatase family protein [Aestuariivirgaceae bacterium]
MPEQAIADTDYDLALETVREAGAVALSRFRKGVKAWRKADGTPVSETDIAVDRLLRERLIAERPGYGWVSEESAATLEAEERFWLVDPIDGTAAYLSGNPSWCISLALIEKGEAVLGFIHAPAEERTYGAARNRGARLNGRAITVSARKELEGSRLIANPSALKPQHWREPLPVVERLSVPSLALRLAYVAEGWCEGAFALSYKHDWDLAAGDVIVREAKGMMSDLDGAALRYSEQHPLRRGFIAAAPGIHAALLARGPKAME